MNKIIKIILAAFLVVLCLTDIHAADKILSAVPYKIKICVFGDMVNHSQSVFTETMLHRCRLQVGQLWDVQIEFPTTVTITMFRDRLPEDGKDGGDVGNADKIFLVELRQSQQIRVQEFDVTTRWLGREAVYEIDHPAKTIDVLLQALFETFSPIARLEKTSPDIATLRVQGADIDSQMVNDPTQQRNTLVGMTMNQSVLLPFIRSYDRDGKLLSISQIPWTVLLAQQVDPISNLLRCRIESAMRDSLGSRRRGQTEIYALAIPTPHLPTTLRLESRMSGKEKTETEAENVLKTLPVYDVFEAVHGEKELKPLGQTRTDGTFVLEPNPDRPFQIVLIRNGRSVVAQVPIIRGHEKDCAIPIPDDAVRLEAEAVLLGIQEDLVDTAARRSLLEGRLKKFEEKKDEKMIRETKGDLSKLKDSERFLMELEQARRRFHSDDPVVQRRSDKLFRDMKKAMMK